MLKRLLPGLAGILLASLASTAAEPAAAQSCATIGSSTFCGTRGSHNTVGNTIIFNNGPAGRRIGSYGVVGTPPRTTFFRGAESRGLAAPRTFTGVATPRHFEPYDAAIARLRAEILAIEAQYQLEQLEQLKLTPAQQAARAEMSPALIRALTLAKQARAKAAGDAAGAPPKPQ